MNAGNWLIIILYLLLPLGQLQRLPLDIPGVSVYAHDLVLTALWAWILWRRLKPAITNTKNKSEKENVLAPFRVRTLRPFVVFTAIAAISWLINLPRWGGESLIGLGYLIRWVLMIAPLICLRVTGYELQVGKLLKKSIFLLVVLGWVQYFIFPDLTRMKYFGWDDHFFRLTGTLLDPNFMGILLVIGLGLEFCHSEGQNGVDTFLKKLFYIITLFFTYSRASYLAWLVLLFGWGINKAFAKPIKGGIFKLGRIFFRSLTAYSVYFWLGVSAIIFVLMPRPEGEGGNLARTASIFGRQENYQQVVEIIKENPIFGVGFNNVRIVNSQSLRSSRGSKGSTVVNHAEGGADNSFLFVWATTGVFGLITFLWLIFSLQPWWLVLPICVHSFFNHSLFFPWVLLYLWGMQLKRN